MHNDPLYTREKGVFGAILQKGEKFMRLKSKTVLSRNLGGNRTMFRTSILVSFLSALVSADLNNHSSNSALLHAAGCCQRE